MHVINLKENNIYFLKILKRKRKREKRKWEYLIPLYNDKVID